MRPSRHSLRWLVSAALAFTLVVGLGLSEANAVKYGLADGWSEVRPQEGRQVAMLHTESLTRMEAWKVALAESDLDRFHAQLERRLKGQGFRLKGQDTLTVASYPATVYRWQRTVRDRTFTLEIVEVYRRGALWQFSSTHLAGALEDTWKEALMTFATSLLSS